MKSQFIIIFTSLTLSVTSNDSIKQINYNDSSQLSSQELLNKSISYHDPNNSWNEFKGIMNGKYE